MKKDLLTTIGNTPLVVLKRIAEGLSVTLAVKLEGFNPGGSVKDRIALSMVEKAEADGILKPKGVIIEPTSGNTGIGLAVVAIIKGYSLIVTMPESMSVERRRILASYGAEVVLTPADQGMRGAVAEAERLESERENAFIPMQFDNPANPDVHRRTTGPEIWEATGGTVDAVVCGIGTGGTATGVGEFLKERRGDIRIIAVEPAESAVLSGKAPGRHRIEGIGAGFVPAVLNRDVIDEIITVTGDEAEASTRRLAREEGIFAGISSGAAIAAAMMLAERDDYSGKRIVVILPDRGDKYLSTALWNQSP